MSVHFVPLPVSTGPRAGGAPPPLGHMVSCKYVCMYVRLCCCKYLSWVPGQLQKRLLREEEAPLCLLVTAQHWDQVPGPRPMGPAGTGAGQTLPPQGRLLCRGVPTPPVSTFPTPSLQKTGCQARSKRPQELEAGLCWSCPSAHRSSGLLPRPPQSPLTNGIYTLC